MKTIAQAVSIIISRKLFLEESMAEGIINLSSLSRLIISDVEKLIQRPVQQSAVLMALNRFAPQTNLQTSFRIRKIFKKIGKIVVRTNLSNICVCNSTTLFDKQRQILDIAIGQKDIFYAFVHGVFESTLVVSSSITDLCKKIMQGETIVDETHDLSSITLKLPEGSIDQSGVFYFILRNLACENINIIEVISTSHEFSIVVKQPDVDKAFGALSLILQNEDQ